jgi:hypothetical protein
MLCDSPTSCSSRLGFNRFQATHPVALLQAAQVLQQLALPRLQFEVVRRTASKSGADELMGYALVP